jgi:hypothetical protein
MQYRQGRMLTKEILFGLNVITLAGFAAMGVALSASRAGPSRKVFSISLMVVGTVLVFAGFYADHFMR